jgi:hypothetical protein
MENNKETAMTRLMKIAGLLTVLLVLGSCGSPAPSGITDGPGDTNLMADDTTRSVSWAYSYYFLDTVNYSSSARWTRENLAGYKQWTLSNTSYSGSKAWVMGMNYWNRENDSLTSGVFTIPANRKGNRLSFYSRWGIAAGDFGYVELGDFSTGETWTNYFTFTNGTNPDYPLWTKYTVQLPDTTENPVTYKLRYRFTSDTSINSWGFGVDSVSVYQRQLSPALNVIASDGLHQNKVDVDWTIQTDNLGRDGWIIYRQQGDGEPWILRHTETNPAQNHFNDTEVLPGVLYSYKVVAYMAGYPDSVDSNIDNGFAENAP